MMWQYNPSRRPSLTEIRNHKWYKGEPATFEKVAEELKTRDREIEEANNQQEMEDPHFDQVPMEEINTTRGFDDSDDEDAVYRETEEYLPELKNKFELFSNNDPDQLFQCLYSYVKDQSEEFTFAKSRYEVDFASAQVSNSYFTQKNNELFLTRS